MGKSELDNVPFHDPTSVMDFYTNIEETTLFDCLKYLPEMDDFYNITNSMLNLLLTDDNPLSYVWLKDSQDEDQKRLSFAMILIQALIKWTLLEKNFSYTEKKQR